MMPALSFKLLFNQLPFFYNNNQILNSIGLLLKNENFKRRLIFELRSFPTKLLFWCLSTLLCTPTITYSYPLNTIENIPFRILELLDIRRPCSDNFEIDVLTLTLITKASGSLLGPPDEGDAPLHSLQTVNYDERTEFLLRYINVFMKCFNIDKDTLLRQISRNSPQLSLEIDSIISASQTCSRAIQPD